jgi:Methyltransferase domain
MVIQGLDALWKDLTCMPTDLESQPEWRERLRSLNSVIASSNELLVGNLFYDGAQADFLDSPPIQRYRVKRERFRAAVRDRRRLLEIGVNGGHSAYLALTENPELEFHGVDICEHSYVENAVAWLKGEFPGRVFFYKGDSGSVLPALAARGLTFDAFHIDGAKHLYYMDIVNSSRMVAPSGALVIVDDSNYLIAKVALSSLANFNVIIRLPEFPSMTRAVGHDDSNNEVRGLVPSSGRKYTLLKSYSYVLATARQIKALAAAVLEVSGLRRG